ncbi:hypothetical protein BO82DRAFT_44506 [Aspergillus uvarum CBS 121591]|uniref:Uncharacterized protein n=1 Tax=Aspergillus uvarum CBS 121591 TaxID=1448315 RepID=A0A319CWM1_9EURO|nr:hypothetical protein BO82DRAFT_44506 [Aspergillus uvarum CBS 121591]PYH83313.1 hypothetical protein BO82DRAFT_44506 [Aspergillus uvarum CBS 121591]
MRRHLGTFCRRPARGRRSRSDTRGQRGHCKDDVVSYVPRRVSTRQKQLHLVEIERQDHAYLTNRCPTCSLTCPVAGSNSTGVPSNPMATYFSPSSRGRESWACRSSKASFVKNGSPLASCCKMFIVISCGLEEVGSYKGGLVHLDFIESRTMALGRRAAMGRRWTGPRAPASRSRRIILRVFFCLDDVFCGVEKMRWRGFGGGFEMR